MRGLYFLLPTLGVIIVSFLVVRAAAIALMMTGLDRKTAKFQALSAFTGTGFTTKEAELVVTHPLRRKITTLLMIFGNAGIVTVIVASTSTFVSSTGADLPINALLLVLGIFVIYKFATRKKLIMSWEAFVENKLVKSEIFEEGATEDLLHFFEGYGLVKVVVGDDSFLKGKALSDFRLNKKGVLILGIEREKKWVPIPKPNEKIEEGDKLVAYGDLDILKSLFKGEENQ